MGDLNIPPDETRAIQAIDEAKLRQLVRQALQDRHTTPLRQMQLESCGVYVGNKFREFERALTDCRSAKSDRKLAEYEYDANRAASYLESAVAGMKARVEQEQEEGQRFYVHDDLMFPPYKFSERLCVRVSFRWRATIEDSWQSGSIEFTHEADLRPDFAVPAPKRKPSAAQQERDRQDKLFHEWDHLRKSALQSVRDYFRSGGSGASIPKTFVAITDPSRRTLNNFSTRFWEPQSG